MHRYRGFTRVDAITILLIVTGLIVLTLVLLQPGSHGDHTSRQMQNSTQLRGIQQGIFLYSQDNNSWYPGLDTNGEVVDSTVQGRWTILLRKGQFFPIDYMISPGETANKIKWESGPVQAHNYSFDMLSMDQPGGRRQEWKDNTNTLVPILCDRNTGNGNDVKSVRSNWTTTPGDWRGGVVFGDNSTQFMTTCLVTRTKYGTTVNLDDNLFKADGPNDTLMIFAGK